MGLMYIDLCHNIVDRIDCMYLANMSSNANGGPFAMLSASWPLLGTQKKGIRLAGTDSFSATFILLGILNAATSFPPHQKCKINLIDLIQRVADSIFALRTEIFVSRQNFYRGRGKVIFRF